MTTTEVSSSTPQPNKPAKKKNKKNRYKIAGMKSIEIGGQFTLIKDIEPPKDLKIGRVLPHWLLHPIPVKRSLTQDLKSPKEACPVLNPKLVKLLKENKITQLFPVQQIVVPHVLKGVNGMESRFRPRDICVATPTGSGKTLAFVLPIIQALCSKSIPTIRALIILPVIELAKQVYKVFNTYAPKFKLTVGQAFGSENFPAEQRNLVKRVYGQYQSKVDILVATPGRLADHIARTEGLDFTELRFLVLDEADKLIAGDGDELISRIQRHLMQFKHQQVNMGLPPFFPLKPSPQEEFYSHQLEEKKNNECDFFTQTFQREVIKLDEMEDDEPKRDFLCVSSPPLQRLLFSATLSHDPEQLQNIDLYRPILFTSDGGEAEEGEVNEKSISEFSKPAELTEELCKVTASSKLLALHYILRKERKKADNFKALVFANSIELTSKITIILKALAKGKYNVQEFSSKLKKTRDVKLHNFLTGKTNVLVSSDATARGIDVPDIDCIISYDVPSANTYIHRIGRTARAGKPGKAISLVTNVEVKYLKRNLGKYFENISERSVSEEKLKKFEAPFQSALNTLSGAMKLRGKKGPRITKTLKRKKVFPKKK